VVLLVLLPTGSVEQGGEHGDSGYGSESKSCSRRRRHWHKFPPESAAAAATGELDSAVWTVAAAD